MIILVAYNNTANLGLSKRTIVNIGFVLLFSPVRSNKDLLRVKAINVGKKRGNYTVIHITLPIHLSGFYELLLGLLFIS